MSLWEGVRRVELKFEPKTETQGLGVCKSSDKTTGEEEKVSRLIRPWSLVENHMVSE